MRISVSIHARLVVAVASSVLLGVGASGIASAASPSPSASSSPSASTAPSAAPKATWGIGPAKAVTSQGRASYQVDAARSNYKWFVTPGSSLTDYLAVVNLGAAPLSLNLYARDATNEADGKLELQPKSATPIGAGSWVTVDLPNGAQMVTVPARSTAYVPVTAHIPAGAGPGDHTGAVISSLTSQVTGNGAQSVNPALEQRVAVPVEIRVSGPVNASISVASVHAHYGQTLNPVGSGHATINYHVVNTGNVNLGAHVQVLVHGLFGSAAHLSAPDVPVLLPGGSASVTVHVSGVAPELLMSAKVSLTPLVPTGDSDTNIVAKAGKGHFWAVPWLLLGIIASLALPFSWRRRLRKRHDSGRHRELHGGGGRRRVPGRPRSTDAAPVPSPVARGVASPRTVGRGMRRWAAGLTFAFLGAGLAVLSPADAAFAKSGVPYTDPSAKGLIALCGANGQDITHGSVYDKPFVFRAVSSVPAPAAYQGTGRLATLYAFQPRKGIEASGWSGDTLTASSTYTNVNSPMAQGTKRDIALSDYLNEFPLAWQGMVELRLIFAAPGVGSDSTSYPVADIKVDGTTWSLVNGASLPCDAGSATSPEESIASSDPIGLSPPEPLAHYTPGVVALPNAKTAASRPTKQASGGGAIEIKVGAAAATLVVAGGIVWWRRRLPA